MKKTLLLLLAAFLFLAAAASLHRPLLERRERVRPAGQTDLRHADPLVAFTTVALGGFRGILADVLWLRASALQEEGRFIEIVQLADWITRLEPTFAEVWSFHAWNMAYNIGFLFDSPPDRWRWVENALRLLREEGLRYNPQDPRLDWEIGWLFFNKIGSYIDQASDYYQIQIYRDMEAVLPGGRLPADARPDPLLWERFRMDGATMAQVDEAFGPLDWRLAESHAVYWAWTGRRKTGPRNDLLLDRLQYQAMIAVCLRGRAYRLPGVPGLVRMARLDLLPKGLRLMDDMAARHADDEGVLSARDYLRRSALLLLHMQGRDNEARALLDRIRADTPDVPPDPESAVRVEAETGRLSAFGFLDQIEGYFFEAHRLRRMGRSADADRIEALATLSFEGVARAQREAGMVFDFSLERIRDGARLKADMAEGTPP